MIKENKGKLIFYSIIILLPIIVGILMWNELPEQVPSHWNVNGEIDGWSSKEFAIFGIPTIMLVTFWLTVLITGSDKNNKEQNRKVINVVLSIIPAVAILVQGYMYTVALGKNMDINIVVIVNVFMGILFLIIGNYLPKCKQNNTIGIRVKWTLRNEENWNRTHRFAGKLWVIGGLIILSSIFFSKYSIVVISLMPIFIAIVPIFYSYFYYLKQLKKEKSER